MKALIVNDTDESLPEVFIHDWLSRALKQMEQAKVLVPEKLKTEVSLVFLKETEAKRLNWTYRGKDYATDILSFENDDPESFGELVFCWSVLQRQAKEHKLTIENELGYMLIHGVLHLLGFDHEKPGPEGEKMLKIQDEIFEKLNMKPTKAKKPLVSKVAPVKAKSKVTAKVPVKVAQKSKSNKIKPKTKKKK